jgi:hypothetical protein
LRAAFADEIATATAKTLSQGSEVALRARAYEPREFRRDRLAPVHANWDVARLRIEMKLRAYYPAQVAETWQRFGESMNDFLRICLVAGDSDLVKSDLARQLDEIGIRGDERVLAGSLVDPANALSLEEALVSGPVSRQYALEAIRSFLLRRADALTGSVFRANLEGFSTTRGDLLRDLLP